MIFTSPRVVAIDDDKHHLDGLGGSLHRKGVACLPIHFTGDPTGIEACPDVRVVFADLNLIGQASDDPLQFATLGGLLEETIAPRGPYFVLLWTRYPDQATDLSVFLNNRLQHVTKPFAVIALAKADHLDGAGNVRDEHELVTAIATLTEGLPQLGALFDWESRVLGATGATVSSLLELASTQATNERTAELTKVLFWLGVEAVGKGHVAADHFRAVNEALLPILADRIGNLPSTPSHDAVWQAAFASTARPQPLTQTESARLNRMIHIDIAVADGSERGVIVLLPPRLEQDFGQNFGVDKTLSAKDQFHCRVFEPHDNRFRWVLVQAQAACDYAQSHPGPIPCYLGLEMPFARRTGPPPAALWISPELEVDGDVRELRVSARFPVSIGPDEFRQCAPIYRLREQILNDLIFHLHSNGARPGMMSFRGR